jgi:hypothetical protein
MTEPRDLTAEENRKRLNLLRAGERESRGRKSGSGAKAPRRGRGKR